MKKLVKNLKNEYSYKDTAQGKDTREEKNMVNSHVISGIVLGLLVIGGGCVAWGKWKMNQDRIRREQKERAQQREKLIEEYSTVSKELSYYDKHREYVNFFSSITPFMQQLLGCERELRLGRSSEDAVMVSLRAAAGNFRQKSRLAESGFRLDFQETPFDAASFRKNCEEDSEEMIRAGLEDARKYLLQYRQYLDVRAIVTGIGSTLYRIVQSIEAHNVDACVRDIRSMEAQLRDFGCFAIYWDNPAVAGSESMRIDFREDSDTATELPGLYSKVPGGGYSLIGTAGGTFRKRG